MLKNQRSSPKWVNILTFVRDPKTIGIILIAYLLRVLVGEHPYSGAGEAPKFGDYEAQRHWMEITNHLKISDWYKNSTLNDLSYWGMDYPPLSGYQSWLHGKFVGYFDPDAIEIMTSRGFESTFSKFLLRLTVLMSDLLIFLPAILTHIYTTMIDKKAGAVAALAVDYQLLGAVLYTMSFFHKHIALYYAPAFFAHILGVCLHRNGTFFKMQSLLLIGFAVLFTSYLCLYPFLESLDTLLSVINRLLPLERGIFEDYVSNFWCVSNVLFKWKKCLDQKILSKLSTTLTLLTAMPCMVQQIIKPSKKGLIYAMINSAIAFYMFGYQVHEKSILLVVLPVTLLFAHSKVQSTSNSENKWLQLESKLFSVVPFASTFSVFPLLTKDKLVIAYWSILLSFYSIAYLLNLWWSETLEIGRKKEDLLYNKHEGAMTRFIHFGLDVLLVLIVLSAICLHAARIFIPPPFSYPFLHDLLSISLSFGTFFLMGIVFNINQWLNC